MSDGSAGRWHHRERCCPAVGRPCSVGEEYLTSDSRLQSEGRCAVDEIPAIGRERNLPGSEVQNGAGEVCSYGAVERDRDRAGIVELDDSLIIGVLDIVGRSALQVDA